MLKKLNTRTLTISYIIALSLIAFLNLFSYALIRSTLSHLDSDATVINLSGRQRMLSQKITKDLLLLVMSTNEETRKNLRQSLVQDTARWNQTHEELQNRDEKNHFAGTNSKKIKQLFGDLNPHFNKMNSALNKIISMENPGIKEDELYRKFEAIIIEESPIYLKIMDEIVSHYEMETLYHVNTLKKKEISIIGAVLILLMLEVLFIFRPMVKKVYETFLENHEHNEELQRNIEKRIEAEKDRDTLIENLNRANLDLQEFTQIVSHDLKAPLRGIIMLSNLLGKECGVNMTEECKESLGFIVQNSKRMNKLVEDILHYSRMGHSNVEMELIDTQLIVKNIVASLLPPKHIDIRINDPLPMVVYNQTQLEEVFQNLISNAISHLGKPEGKITILCRELEEFWEFSIEDNGVGIEERHQKRIFQIFERVHTTENKNSTGIGLTVVKKIIETHGGSVGVHSIVGKGSTFFFTIKKNLKPGGKL